MAEPNWTEIRSLIKDNFREVLSDQVFEGSAMLKVTKAEMLDKEKGGRNLVISPVLYDKLKAHGAVADFGDVDINPNPIFTAVEYDWKVLYCSIALGFREINAAAASDLALINLIKQKVEVGRMTLTDDLAKSLYNDGTDPKYPHGLRKLVNVDNSVGGIDSTNWPFWDANLFSDVTNYSKANLLDPTSAYYCLKLMRKMWRASRHNNDAPTIITMTGGWHDIFAEELEPRIDYTPKDIRTAAVDFADFSYKGQAPMVEDDILTEEAPGYLFAINKKWFKLYIDPEDDFNVGPFQKPANKLDRVCQITLTCQWATNGRRMLGGLRAAAAIED